MKRIKNLIVAVLSLGLLLAPLGLSAPAWAACTATGDNAGAKQQVLNGIAATGGDCSGSGVTTVINSVVNILSIVVGIIAVIMIIISAFKYITSGGDSNSVSSAKNSLIYALVGLAVVALAQFMIHFVFNTAKTAAGTGYLPSLRIDANA